MTDIKTVLWNLREELFDELPTGDIDAFELLKIVKEHIKKLDELIEEI